ncbi:ADP-heptose synthase [Paenibacillus piri]|uniref:ADP-heptose synthase n=1 Tax=Paenibacillus piri TaxID=2547395 RepID=A0A4R5KUH9_9BACL|nr:ADP-heptose synthase [Paenibacillus piri]TDF98587.1 ADP-heptose synthase [Paenibacillus piri]
MRRRLVIEAVMLAIYGELFVPEREVEYLIPYSTIQELYELRESREPIMPDREDEAHVRVKIGELISMLEEPFNRKKMERALSVPWSKSLPFPINDNVSLTVIYAIENAEYGEQFDPIETDLILISLHEKAPLLTDQPEFTDKLIDAEVPVQVYDMEDFEYAVEGDHE